MNITKNVAQITTTKLMDQQIINLKQKFLNKQTNIVSIDLTRIPLQYNRNYKQTKTTIKTTKNFI